MGEEVDLVDAEGHDGRLDGVGQHPDAVADVGLGGEAVAEVVGQHDPPAGGERRQAGGVVERAGREAVEHEQRRLARVRVGGGLDRPRTPMTGRPSSRPARPVRLPATRRWREARWVRARRHTVDSCCARCPRDPVRAGRRRAPRGRLRRRRRRRRRRAAGRRHHRARRAGGRGGGVRLRLHAGSGARSRRTRP